MPRPRKALSEADRAAWAVYAAQLRPLPGRALPVVPPPPPAPVLVEKVGAALPTPRAVPRDAGVAVGAAPAGLDRATWHRFQSGKLAVERRLDLHGHTVQHAYQRFEQVLLLASAQGLRCVEVITGRGVGEAGGILRRELPLWLNLPHLRHLVLAAAHPHAANQGAVRLLLRRNTVSPRAAPPSPQSRRGGAPRGAI